MKITPDHLARGAFIYVRQSTVDQLANNHESRRRQYGLADRARALGWTDVTVIDDDLGRSGSGVNRPGFERLLAAICEGRVGAVFAIEASGLARNGRDWHTLIEFCGLVGTVIVDEDGTYEPRHPNDRLLLGMKGTMSELELSLLRARSMEALKQKARRGELFFSVAVGYVKVGRDKIEMDPDLRVREAIGLVFTRFAEMQSIRQVFLSLRGDQIALPYIDPKVSGQHQVLWKLPVYTTVSNLLTNPVYAGTYAFGRTGSRMTIENGRKRIVRGRRKDRSDWAVLLVDHHEGYLSWADFERNQRLIADNANGKGMMVRGPVRKGRLCSPACYAVVIAAAGCLSATMAPRAMSAAIIVTLPGAIPVLLPVSRSALCGLMRRWEPRLCDCCSHLVLKRPSKRSHNASTSLAKNNARSSWRSNRRDTRQPGHADSMTRST